MDIAMDLLTTTHTIGGKSYSHVTLTRALSLKCSHILFPISTAIFSFKDS